MTAVLSASQARAARALIDMSRAQLSDASGVDERIIREFEQRLHDPGDDTRRRIRAALEQAGVTFVPENAAGGAGVRLKFSRKEVRAVNRWENEGGVSGEDDV